MVPVLRNCHDMSYADVEKGIAALGQKAKNNDISIEDMDGGTFTIRFDQLLLIRFFVFLPGLFQQWRSLRFSIWNTNYQSTSICHSWHARCVREACSQKRSSSYPPYDVHRSHLRPSSCWRPWSRHLLENHQVCCGRPQNHVDGFVMKLSVETFTGLYVFGVM